MKIVIEFDNSYSAKLTIDGKQLTVESKPGLTTLVGCSGDECDATLGGIVASELYSLVAKIQQAWAAADEVQPNAGTWDRLQDVAIDEANERVWR